MKRADFIWLLVGLMASLVLMLPYQAAAAPISQAATNTPTPTATLAPGQAGVQIYVTPTSTPVPGTPQPAAWWRFDDGAGTTVADSSGNGYGGAVNGATWNGSGASGGSLSFDGNDSVSVPANASLEPLDAFTISLWVNPDAAALSGDHRLLDKGSVYSLWLSGGRVEFRSSVLGTVTGTALQAGVWSHLVIVYDRFKNGGQILMYVNGALVATQDGVGGPLTYTGNSLLIGDGFAGSLDEIGFYDVALSAAQATALYSMPSGPIPLPTATPGGSSESSAGSGNDGGDDDAPSANQIAPTTAPTLTPTAVATAAAVLPSLDDIVAPILGVFRQAAEPTVALTATSRPTLVASPVAPAEAAAPTVQPRTVSAAQPTARPAQPTDQVDAADAQEADGLDDAVSLILLAVVLVATGASVAVGVFFWRNTAQ